jgi:catechol-2,3-dioxygenase
MIDRIDHIVMNCRDVEATASWYEGALYCEDPDGNLVEVATYSADP